MQPELSSEQHLAELGEAARRAGAIVTEHINSIVEGAERHAQQIIADAHGEGERTRRDALDSAQRLLEHLQALERPLGQLVVNLQAEVDRVSGELGRGDYVDADAHPAGIAAAPEEAEVEEEPQVEAEQQVETEQQVEAEEQIEEEQVEAEEPEAPSPESEPQATVERPLAPPPQVTVERPLAPPQPAPPPAEAPKPRRRMFGRLRRGGSGIFITTEGNCAVCQRAFMAGSEENLQLSGWLVNEDVGLCPDCQSEGWQLPEGARLPFRRGGS